MAELYDINGETQFGVAIREGLVNGVSGDNSEHAKANLPSLTEVVVSSGVDTTLANFPFLSDTGEDIEIVSDNAADTDAAITLIGLNADGTVRREDIQLTGTTPVVSSGWRRVNGSITKDPTPTAGNVSIRRASDSVELFQQTPAAQKGFCGVYTLGADVKGALINLIITMQKDGGANTGVLVQIYSRIAGSDVFRLEFANLAQRDGNGSPDYKNPIPDFAAPLTDIVFTATSESAGAGVFIRSTWELLKTASYPYVPPGSE